jgi:glycine/D-amino acid oxidase-like deaminating enzyme
MFLYNDRSPVTFNDELPHAVDVVVIGGGIVGISTAWYLLEKGLTVLVCDKGRVAGEQSSRNWGWVRVMGRDPDEVPIAMDSQKCWREIADTLDEDVGFEQNGVLALARDDDDMANFEEWRKIAASHDLNTQLFGANDIRQHIDVPQTGFVGGMVTPTDCRAEPFLAVPAIARGVQKRGGLIRENCAVRTIDYQAGRVCGVATESGQVRAQSVVCAAGAWSTMLFSNHDISLPQLTVKGTVVRTEAAPEIYGGAAGIGDIFVRRRQDGGYTVASAFTEHTIGANSFRFLTKFIPSMGSASDIGVRVGRDISQQSFLTKRWNADDVSPFEKHRVLNPTPSREGLDKIRRNFDKRVPALAGLDFAESWAGMIDATPDVVPVMDAIPEHPGLFLATGFSGHGFGIGPGAGKVMAGLVCDDSPEFDLTRFRFSRFSDGSKMRPGPAI